MGYYSICTLLIEIEEKPSDSFNPFLVNTHKQPMHVDMSIKHISLPQSTEHLVEVVRLSYMNIYKTISNNRINGWIYKASNGMSIFYTDTHYLHANYCYENALDSFNKSIAMGVLSPYFHLLIEMKLVQHGLSILHAACVAIDGIAYAFTGPSGIGKSTRAQKWCDHFSGEWISGDRPAIDGNTRTVYGVPWDGKESIYRNVKRPLAAIIKVTRSETTEIREMTYEDKLQLLCEQSFFPLWDSKLAINAMHSIKQLAYNVPVYELCCDITDESTDKSFKLVKEAINSAKEINRDISIC